jgi:hypothetical protein
MTCEPNRTISPKGARINANRQMVSEWIQVFYRQLSSIASNCSTNFCKKISTETLNELYAAFGVAGMR